MTPEPKPLEKQPSDYSLMMKALSDETGPIPDGGAQGQAVNWLLKNYTVQECIMVLKEMFKESKPNGGWRGRVSWLNVKSEIGTRLSKLRHSDERSESHIVRTEDTLSETEARELYNMLGEDYGPQRELIRNQYGF